MYYKNKKVLIVSKSSGLNFGDKLIAISLMDILINNGAFKVDLMDLHLDEFPLEKISINRKEKYSIKVSRFALISKSKFIIKVMLFKIYDRIKIYNKLQSYDHVIIGGGNLLDERGANDSLFRVCEIAKIALELNKSYEVVAVGVGGYPKISKDLRLLIKNATRFTVRDNKSKEKLINFQLNIIDRDILVERDPVFSYKWIKPAEEKIDILGVNLINIKRINGSNFDLRKFSDSMIELANISKCKRIRIIVTTFGEDIDVSNALFDEIIKSGKKIDVDIKLVSDVETMYKSYAGIKFFICCRMHSWIISKIAKISSLVYVWDDKISSIIEDLDEGTVSDVTWNLDELDPQIMLKKLMQHSNSLNSHLGNVNISN